MKMPNPYRKRRFPQRYRGRMEPPSMKQMDPEDPFREDPRKD